MIRPTVDEALEYDGYAAMLTSELSRIAPLISWHVPGAKERILECGPLDIPVRFALLNYSIRAEATVNGELVWTRIAIPAAVLDEQGLELFAKYARSRIATQLADFICEWRPKEGD